MYDPVGSKPDTLTRAQYREGRKGEGKKPDTQRSQIPDSRASLTYKHTVATGRECVLVV